MKKLSAYRDEEALDLLADLLEPAAMIMADPDVADALKSGNRMKAIKKAVKAHKPQVMEVLAIMEGVPVEEYHCNVLTVPMRLLEILNDDDLIAVFTSQAQEMMQGISSGPAMETTGGKGE